MTRNLQKGMLVALLAVLGCGGSGSSNVNINQQQSTGGGNPSNCTAACTLGCADTGGLTFEVACQTFDSSDTTQSGVAATIGQLPTECLGQQIPACGSSSTETNGEGASSTNTDGSGFAL